MFSSRGDGYTSSEIAAIKEFVEGGTVILMTILDIQAPVESLNWNL